MKHKGLSPPMREWRGWWAIRPNRRSRQAATLLAAEDAGVAVYLGERLNEDPECSGRFITVRQVPHHLFRPAIYMEDGWRLLRL